MNIDCIKDIQRRCILCNYNKVKEYKNVTLFSFPIFQPENLERWCKMMNVEPEFVDKYRPKVCSDHFKEEDTIQIGTRKLLKKNSLPILSEEFLKSTKRNNDNQSPDKELNDPLGLEDIKTESKMYPVVDLTEAMGPINDHAYTQFISQKVEAPVNGTTYDIGPEFDFPDITAPVYPPQIPLIIPEIKNELNLDYDLSECSIGVAQKSQSTQTIFNIEMEIKNKYDLQIKILNLEIRKMENQMEKLRERLKNKGKRIQVLGQRLRRYTRKFDKFPGKAKKLDEYSSSSSESESDVVELDSDNIEIESLL